MMKEKALNCFTDLADFDFDVIVFCLDSLLDIVHAGQWWGVIS